MSDDLAPPEENGDPDADPLPEEARPARLAQGRAYKDGGLGVVLNRDAPARTPCEAAWKIPAYRERVLAWLADVEAIAFAMFHVRMPNGELRDAVFRREERILSGQRVMVAADSLSRTVFAARRHQCSTVTVVGRRAS